MGEHRIKKLEIERYAVGELDRSGSLALEAHLEACPDCNSYYARIKQEHVVFLAAHPFSATGIVSEHAGGAPEKNELWYERLFGGLALPFLRPVLIPACLLLLVAMMAVPFIGRYTKDTTPGGNAIAYKGTGAQLSYIYKRDGTIHESADGDLFRPGDKVQVFYASAEDRFLTLLSIDSAGTVSFYQPDPRSNVCSIRSGVGTRLAYPQSIDLDDAPGAELVAAVFSDTAMTAGQVKNWVATVFTKGQAMADLEKKVHEKPPVRSTVTTLLLRKK